jgi:5-methylcytosine-specific restriction endonuclease McrA
MNDSLRNLVRRRAHNRCEYCGLPELLAPVVPLHVEHIVPRKHKGRTEASNLALGCYHCNLHKQTDLVGIDPHTGARAALFNPRRHKWHVHFRWEGVFLRGKTAIGRATVEVLAMNDDPMIELRSAFQEEGAFPW